MANIDDTSRDIRVVREEPAGDPLGLVHPGWTRAFPWLAQGTTTRGSGPDPFDLGLFSGGSPIAKVLANWAALGEATAAHRAVHARQVHGATVRRCGVAGGRGVAAAIGAAGEDDRGPTLVDPCDGHVTDQPGVLLAVTTADCVPISIVDPERRAVAALHAGWRGAAAGILERGLAVMSEAFGTDASDVDVHFGPSICGRCYEVGPEVFEALGLERPAAPLPVDLRQALASRAVSQGVSAERMSVSAHCTRCTGSRLFSHRGGDPQRQVTYLGIRT